MQPVLKEVENFGREDEIRYEIFIDEEDLNNIFRNTNDSFDFGDEEANQEYKNRFANEELCSYGIVKYKLCKCCCMWSECDSLWAIHAESPIKAFEFYKETN